MHMASATSTFAAHTIQQQHQWYYLYTADLVHTIEQQHAWYYLCTADLVRTIEWQHQRYYLDTADHVHTQLSNFIGCICMVCYLSIWTVVLLSLLYHNVSNLVILYICSIDFMAPVITLSA